MDEVELLTRLRAREEGAYREVIEAYSPSMLKVSRAIVGAQATAEEVVQETWLAVLKGLDRFEGRSSLKTWVFRILVNQSRKRIKRDSRVRNWSEISERSMDEVINPLEGRFDNRGHWSQPPASWGNPEREAINRALVAIVARALEELPPTQKLVVMLRDVEGFAGPEVCEMLELSSANQRVLLHRGRSQVRAEVEKHLQEVA